jgi:hypothetical protein
MIDYTKMLIQIKFDPLFPILNHLNALGGSGNKMGNRNFRDQRSTSTVQRLVSILLLVQN